MSILLKAPAKINLYLRVGEKRPDGFHEIESLFQMIDLCDTLRLEPLPFKIELMLSGRPLQIAGENLVVRAARLLREASGVTQGARIRLSKQIPAGAGLGGGSSDAAAALSGLNRLWNLGWPYERLLGLAARIGSDVPFFLGSPTALVRGRGDLLQKASLDRSFWAVVIFPGIEVRTSWAYARLDERRFGLTRGIRRTNIIKFSEKKAVSLDQVINIENDLETISASAYPKIAQAKKSLEDSGALLSRMSGSGSAVFGLFSTGKKGFQAAAALKREWGIENVWCCCFLKRAPLQHSLISEGIRPKPRLMRGASEREKLGCTED
jgi:4-diphosphocytidyl-2-C-methyl-D-erythritol kinase